VPGLFERFRIEAAFASAIVILVGAGYFSYHALMESRRSAGWVQHTYEVLDTLDQLSSAVAVVESSSRGFAITGNESYVAPLERAVQDIGARAHIKPSTSCGDRSCDPPGPAR
jgi:CHASE3 domain sensor protein